jgi:hypothetical protein
VLGFVFLIIGVLCALIGRILLASAAFGISVWWGLGVFLPFGPLFFRSSYPEAAAQSRWFRVAAIPCFLLYLCLGPSSSISFYKHRQFDRTQSAPTQLVHYALEKPVHSPKGNSVSSGPVVQLTPNVEERRAANAHEFERLRQWKEALRLRKRDLLHSDAEGNRAYSTELAQYNDAFAKANTEKNALAALTN